MVFLINILIIFYQPSLKLLALVDIFMDYNGNNVIVVCSVHHIYVKKYSTSFLSYWTEILE